MWPEYRQNRKIGATTWLMDYCDRDSGGDLCAIQIDWDWNREHMFFCPVKKWLVKIAFIASFMAHVCFKWLNHLIRQRQCEAMSDYGLWNWMFHRHGKCKWRLSKQEMSTWCPWESDFISKPTPILGILDPWHSYVIECTVLLWFTQYRTRVNLSDLLNTHKLWLGCGNLHISVKIHHRSSCSNRQR